MDLLALADFTLVGRYGGFGRAARATGRPKATLSRRVADLERSLGVRLFERGARTLKLTVEGQALFTRAGTLLAELDETVSAIAAGSEQPSGRLRISAPLLFAQTAMGKLAAGFALRYPGVRLEVITEDRPVDMVEEGYDLVIRVNPAPDENLVGRIFLRDRLVVVASPNLARPAVNVPVPVIVRNMRDQTKTWSLLSAEGKSHIVVEPVLSLSSMTMIRDAVRAGVGAGRLPLSLVNDDVQRGALVYWGNADSPETELWALYPSRRLLSIRVSAFLDYLREAFPEGKSEELARFLSE